MTARGEALPPALSQSDLLPSDAELAREARVLTRYLLSRDCPPALVQRYIDASRARPRPAMTPADNAIVQAAMRNALLLPFLDAASGITKGGTALRDKLLLMAAVLEASPDFADEFLPRSASRTFAVLTLAWCTIKSAAKVAIGVPLSLIVRRAVA